MSGETSIKRILHYAVLLLMVFSAIGPFLWLLSTALKSPGENIFAYPPRFIPESPTLSNFSEVWKALPMLSYFKNSLAVTLFAIVFNLIFSTLAAYPLARMNFRGKEAVFYAVLATMMIPFQVIMVPMYLVMLKLGMTDAAGQAFFSRYPVNLWLGLSLPFAISGFGVFFVRQALVTLPRDLEESAVIDGCNSFQVLWRVLLPLIRPTLATLAVLTFLSSWGELLWPSILISEPENYTLPVGLVNLQGAFSANWRLIAAGSILAMLPILVFFTILQRYFVSGALEGSVKG